MAKLIKESAATGTLTGSRMEITLITPGWGSSGYYSPSVLEQAAADKVFPRGTQMHIDHMTETQRMERPSGSVDTLAAALDEDARWEPNWVDPDTGAKGRIVAESRVFSRWRDHVNDVKEVIGASIVAGAEVSIGEAEGRKGRIVEALTPGVLNRVDFVTAAGRGGRITEVLEAAKVEEARNVGAWLEARMHSGFTQISDDMYGDGRLTREERITLSGALGEALQAFTARVEADAPQLFERDLWQEPEAAATVGENAPKNVPSNLAGSTETNESKEIPMAKIEVDEAAHTAAVEASGRVPALEAENADLKAKLAESAKKDNDSTAAAVVAEAFQGISAPATVALLASTYALTTEGAVDTAALKAKAEESAAEIAASFGAGKVRGVGHAAESTAPTRTAEDIVSVLEGGK